MAKKNKDWDAELKKLQAEEDAQIAKLDARHRAKGYTHRVTGWIHPDAGDDKMIDVYVMGKPTPAILRDIFRRSVVKNDYAITKL